MSMEPLMERMERDEGSELRLEEIERRARTTNGDAALNLRDWLALAEAWRIAQALRDARGNRSAAARTLGIGRRTLYTKIDKLGLVPAWRVARAGTNGSLRLPRDDLETEDLRESLPELRHDGFPMREVALAGVLPATASEHFHAAFEVPEDGVLHPVGFVHGLAAQAALGR